MDFDQALQMAVQIREHYPRLGVMAIGRFIPPEELDTTPERWGISVRVDRGDRPCVIWSRDQLLAFSSPAAPRRSSSRKSQPPVEQAGGLLLF